MDEIALSVSFCEVASPAASAGELEGLLAETCREAGFPHCERVYAGSYFCENFFCGLADAFHESMRALCQRYDMGATLVIPVIGQAFLERATARLADVLDRFGDVYDEVVVNDVASFLALAGSGKRLGLGRLFSKEMRDARLPNLMERTAMPELSAEALECLESSPQRPLVEIDPVASVVDASRILEDAPSAEIALHLPYCYATTGRNCGPASIDETPDEKFRIGRGCSRHCLRMAQGYLTGEGVEYVKHGRTFYFANPGCAIAGAGSWRIIYAAAHETMRL